MTMGKDADFIQRRSCRSEPVRHKTAASSPPIIKEEQPMKSLQRDRPERA